jgi:Yip1-like protein
MNLVARAKAILMTPKQEWPVIDAEPLNVRELLLGYVLPLAAIGPIAAFIGTSVFGFGGIFRVSMGWALSHAITSFVLAVLSVFVLAWVINVLAPNFGATQNMQQAIKLSAYSATAGWVAGIFYLIPALWMLAAIGGIYSLYLFYLGLPVLMKVPADKAVPYIVVVVVSVIVLYWLTAWIGGL